MESLSEDLADHRELLQTAADYVDINAQRLSIVTVRAPNFRREESGKLRMLSEAAQINKILDDLRRYIDVLQQSQVRYWREESVILWGRYAQHRTWPDILQELYGDQPDFLQKKDAYKRRLFRRHDSALEDIWTHFDTKSQEKSKGGKNR